MTATEFLPPRQEPAVQEIPEPAQAAETIGNFWHWKTGIELSDCVYAAAAGIRRADVTYKESSGIPLMAWRRLVAKQEMIKLLRRGKTYGKIFTEWPSIANTDGEDIPLDLPDENAPPPFIEMDVETYLGCLDQRERLAVEMRYLQKVELVVIGQEFGISAEGARLLIQRALRKIRESLKHA